MRTDVRLGVFFSMVIVLTLGGYFVYPRGGTEAIPLTGGMTQAGEHSTPTKLASNSNMAAGRKKSPTTARKTQTVRNAKTANSRKGFPKKSTRHATGPGKRRSLPVSGATLGNADRTARGKTVVPGKRRGLSPQQQANARRNAASKTPKLGHARKTGGQDRVASTLTDKPGTPTPPGLLAATRKKAAPKNEPAVDLHRVQPGDTFAALAEAYYGSAKYVEFLMKANPDVDPARMRVGATIRVPALSAKGNAATKAPITKQVKKPRSSTSTSKTYTVRPGDSFYRIAKQQLGDASRWEELFEANKKVVGSDPARLKVGQVLALPTK